MPAKKKDSDLKIKKDALVSALFSLSKAATETSNAALEFFTSIDGTDKKAVNKIMTGVSKDLESIGTILNGEKATESITNEKENEPVNTASNSAGKENPDVISSAKDIEGDKVQEKGNEENTTTPSKKRKRQSKPKDPNAPKRPHSSYFAYLTEARKLIPEERKGKGLPPLNSAEIAKEVAVRWHGLTPEEKKPWNDLYLKEKEVYEKLKDEYNKKTEDSSNQASSLPIEQAIVGEVESISPVQVTEQSNETNSSGALSQPAKKMKFAEAAASTPKPKKVKKKETPKSAAPPSLEKDKKKESSKSVSTIPSPEKDKKNSHEGVPLSSLEKDKKLESSKSSIPPSSPEKEKRKEKKEKKKKRKSEA